MSEAKPRARRPKEEWHLVCITRKGKVSMLKNLDLLTARETYKKLLPGTHPREYVRHECKRGNEQGWFSSGGMSFGSDSDRLEKVEALGPEGVELDPWHGVEPMVIHRHCQCGCMFDPEPAPAPELEPEWDERRTDFWNAPGLWDGIEDPRRQMIWERLTC